MRELIDRWSYSREIAGGIKLRHRGSGDRRPWGNDIDNKIVEDVLLIYMQGIREVMKRRGQYKDKDIIIGVNIKQYINMMKKKAKKKIQKEKNDINFAKKSE